MLKGLADQPPMFDSETSDPIVGANVHVASTIRVTDNDANSSEPVSEHEEPNPETLTPGVGALITKDTEGVFAGALDESDFQGKVESADWNGITGWIWNPDNVGDRVRLELVDDDRVLAKAVANQPRPDLISLGIGDGRYGFHIRIQGGDLTQHRHVLYLRCPDTGEIIPWSRIMLERPQDQETAAQSLPRAPLDDQSNDANPKAQMEAQKPIHALRHYVDSISDGGITGWVMRPAQPTRRCVVALMEGDEIVSRATASAFRPDLLAAGIGDGCHAFVMPMPRRLLDGEEHQLEIVELDTGTPLTSQPVRWRSTVGTADIGLTGVSPTFGARVPGFEVRHPGVPQRREGAQSSRSSYMPATEHLASATWPPTHTIHANPSAQPKVLLDISDLVYFIGQQSNLTGIQRVQSSVVLSIVNHHVLPTEALLLLSYNIRSRGWSTIPTGVMVSILRDLFLPEDERRISFSSPDARDGILPGATDFNGIGVLDDGAPSVFCVLGAAWVQRDYFHRVANFKRLFGTRLVVTIHDLISIYARETCDRTTAIAFEEFLRRAYRHADQFLSVSECTARDLQRHSRSLSLKPPPIVVTGNGSSFEEFIPQTGNPHDSLREQLPDRFVLFVGTIEGRKNHALMLEIWRRMVDDGDDPPHLICVGRVGWKAEAFIVGLVETNYLDGRIILMSQVSDSQLKLLYRRCLFTVFPSLYEGWGLPVSESLAAGKVCVCSDRAAIPEIAGKLGVYIDVDNLDQSYKTLRHLLTGNGTLSKLEMKIREEYEPVTWKAVADRVITACLKTSKSPAPSPYVAVPYSKEVSFAAAPGRAADGISGDVLLSQIVEARAGLFLYEPLHESNFLYGEDARFGGNWAEPENWGTWLCHSGGEIVMELAPSESQAYSLFLRVRASGPLSELHTRLYIDDQFIWGENIGNRPRNIMLRFRKPTGTKSGWRLRLRAEAILTPDLRDKIAAADGRIPTIGFERLVVVPDNDLKTRINILSKLAM